MAVYEKIDYTANNTWLTILRDLSEINRGGGNIELKVGNEVTHLSNRNEISLPSPRG